MPVFDYCERLSSSFWAEPINALSNIFFILGAYLALKHLCKSRLEQRDIFSFGLLIFVLTLIGTGSFLWHTYASPWAELADVIPISIFMHFYLYFFSRNIMNFSLLVSLFFVLSFALINYLFSSYINLDSLNGSIAYLPALLYLFIMAVIIQKTPYIRSFILAILTFSVSICFRTIDFMVCEFISIGTHFVWHTLNAIFLYKLITLLVDAKKDVKQGGIGFKGKKY